MLDKSTNLLFFKKQKLVNKFKKLKIKKNKLTKLLKFDQTFYPLKVKNKKIFILKKLSKKYFIVKKKVNLLLNFIYYKKSIYKKKKSSIVKKKTNLMKKILFWYLKKKFVKLNKSFLFVKYFNNNIFTIRNKFINFKHNELSTSKLNKIKFYKKFKDFFKNKILFFKNNLDYLHNNIHVNISNKIIYSDYYRNYNHIGNFSILTNLNNNNKIINKKKKYNLNCIFFF